MKILDSYKKMAYSLMIEADIDDEKMIKYRDKDGESKEMKAGSAKKLSKDHPAKIAYDTMAKYDDYQNKKDAGDKLGGGDFDRDGDGDVDKGGEPMDTKVDSFEDSKKFVASLEDVESDLSDLGQNFTDNEQFERTMKSLEGKTDDMDVELEDRYYGEVQDRIDNVRKEISRITYDDPNAVDYEDDTELQDKITQSVKDKVDNLSDDTKEFLNNREEFMKKLYDPNEYDIGLKSSSDDYNDALDSAGVSSNDSIDDVRDRDWEDLQYDIATSAAEKYGLNDPAAVYDYMKQKGGYNTVQDVIDNADEIGKRYTKGGKGIKDSIQINGKKYRKISESKKPNKHILKENYQRFFGDKK